MISIASFTRMQKACGGFDGKGKTSKPRFCSYQRMVAATSATWKTGATLDSLTLTSRRLLDSPAHLRRFLLFLPFLLFFAFPAFFLAAGAAGSASGAAVAVVAGSGAG